MKLEHLSKSKFCLCLIATAYLVTLIFYDQLIFEWTQEFYNKLKTDANIQSFPDAKKLFSFNKHQIPKDKNGKKKPVILMWRPPFGSVHQNPDICGDCLLTYDQFAISVASAVVFHCADTSDMRDRYPWRNRDPKQRWVWMCTEPPWQLRYLYEKKLTDLTGVFNWTMTYRTDSNIFHSYIQDTSKISTSLLKVLLDRKKKDTLVSWIVSNCVSTKRNELAEELSRHVSVDFFGKCANKKVSSVCEIVSRYKFYLAFENSECKEYITEKFWYNALLCGAIPVVLGPPRSQYELVAPPNSFIHFDDFESIKELAEYLKKLDGDDESYRKYFEWRLQADWKEKKRAQFPGYGENGMCQLCNKLHQASNEVDIVENLDQWWYGDGYTPNNPNFPICSTNSGRSGFSTHWITTLNYSAGFAAVFLVVLCFTQKSFRGLFFAMFTSIRNRNMHKKVV